MKLVEQIPKSEKTSQQADLWMQEGDRACLNRQFIRGIHYYQRALDLAGREGLHELKGKLCRDLAYVYLHHGAYTRALQLLEEGLSLEFKHPELRLGLLINKISAILAEKKYQEGFEVTEEAIEYFLSQYPKREDTPSTLLSTFDALRHLETDLQRVVELLGSGMKQDRIQVDFQLAPPPWISHSS